MGLDNLATCVTNNGKSFIVDGRRLKSINQWYNKQNARLQSIKDKQKLQKRITNRQAINNRNRNNKINDYMNKTARKIINYCLDNNIGNLVCGYNETFQKDTNIGKVNNQNFTQIPLGKLREKLEYLCMFYGIGFIKQEESYTSKASFFDQDKLPIYSADNPHKYDFSGKRIKHRQYSLRSSHF